jgi:hypothetical protein
MARRMLLAGVGDYQGFTSGLVAPVQEIARWEKLLSKPPYGLTSVILPKSASRPVPLPTPLIDATATRRNILDGLDELLKNAEPGDQLLFLLLCRGSIYPDEQAFIVYPEGNRDLRKAAVTFTDLLDVLKERKPPAEVDITFVFGSCFAAGIINEKLTPLFIPPADLALEDRELRPMPRNEREHKAIRKFTELAELNALIRSSEPLAEVVIVTASRANEAAYQIKVQENPEEYRLLFCSRAISRLRASHDTFDELEAYINPLQVDVPQHADVHGSKERTAEKFPGEDGTSSAASELKAAATADSWIQVRILGMGCFIPAREGEDDPFAERIVLPHDTQGPDPEKHIAFVEVAEEDIHHLSGKFTSIKPTTHYRGGVYYKRWTLTNHSVKLTNPAPGSFERITPFNEYVPEMHKVCPELTSPRTACYQDYPQADLFSGFIDVASGSVEIGQLLVPVQFALEIGDIPTLNVTTPLSVVLTLPFTGDYAHLVIRNEGGSDLIAIFIKSGAHLLAGNAREQDITGDGKGDNSPEHFRAFYNLVDPPVNNPGMPREHAAPINACSVTRFP